jgi:hypothetical protein
VKQSAIHIAPELFTLKVKEYYYDETEPDAWPCLCLVIVVLLRLQDEYFGGGVER